MGCPGKQGQEGQQENGPCPDGTEPGGEQHPQAAADHAAAHALESFPPQLGHHQSGMGGAQHHMEEAPPTTGSSPRHHSRPVGRFSRQNTSTHDAHNRAGAANQNPWPIRPRIPPHSPSRTTPWTWNIPRITSRARKAHTAAAIPGPGRWAYMPGVCAGRPSMRPFPSPGRGVWSGTWRRRIFSRRRSVWFSPVSSVWKPYFPPCNMESADQRKIRLATTAAAPMPQQ